jgi:hypothetical protein
MSITTKRRFVTLLKTFNALGLLALLVLTFVILGQIKKQALINHADTAKAVTQIKEDHDLQNSYLRCIVSLFVNSEDDAVTDEQTAICLAQVRAGTTKTNTIQPTPENGQTTTTTTTNQSSPNDEPIAPQKTQPTPAPAPTTTSAPPDPEQQFSQQSSSTEPSIFMQTINTARGILGL